MLQTEPELQHIGRSRRYGNMYHTSNQPYDVRGMRMKMSAVQVVYQI